MDGTKFDALTKRLATGTSRRRVLAGLGSALAGALALGGGAPAAPEDACAATLRGCLAQARAAAAAARQGCQAGPSAERATCLGDAGAGEQAAAAACTTAMAACAVGPTCQPGGTICLHNRECCSGRCTLNSVDPPRGRCTYPGT